MKFSTIMIATGLIAAAATTASAESVFEPTGSAVQGQSAQSEGTIRYLSSGRDGHAMSGSSQATHGAGNYGYGNPQGPNVLRDGRG